MKEAGAMKDLGFEVWHSLSGLSADPNLSQQWPVFKSFQIFSNYEREDLGS